MCLSEDLNARLAVLSQKLFIDCAITRLLSSERAEKISAKRAFGRQQIHRYSRERHCPYGKLQI